MSAAILVTGAGGMIGRRLVTALAAEGHEVIAASRRPLRLPRHIANPFGDLSHSVCRNGMFRLLARSDTSERIVMHLAALNLVGKSPPEYASAFRDNVALTESLLEGSERAACNRFFFASTGLVYGTGSGQPRSESSRTVPAEAFYAWTKLAAEQLIQAWASGSDMRCEIVRLSNVFGPDSTEATVVGRILAQVRRRQPIAVASGAPVRDFLYVDDVVAGFTRLIGTPLTRPIAITNLSTAVGTSVASLVACVAKMTGLPAAPLVSAFNRQADCLVLNNSRLTKRLGWAPQSNLVEQLQICVSLKK